MYMIVLYTLNYYEEYYDDKFLVEYQSFCTL